MYQSIIQAKGVFSEGNLDEIESLNFSHRPGLARLEERSSSPLEYFTTQILLVIYICLA